MDEKELSSLKGEFVSILQNTGRRGIENVLLGLEKIGFYEAPASSRFHCAFRGGLLVHSMNVYRQAEALRDAEAKINPGWMQNAEKDSIAIAALLHDVCKADIYRPVKKYRKDEGGKWQEYDGWDVDQSGMPLGHGEKSVIRLLRMGLEMTTGEILAIRWHMGKWDLSESRDATDGFNAACDRTPLLPLLMAADSLASRISEHEERGNVK